MVGKIVTNTIAENVSTVGCSRKPVEYSHPIAGSIARPEIRQNMNMKLTGWIGGRQRSEAEYTAHRNILRKMMMSPMLNVKCVSTTGSSVVVLDCTQTARA